MPYIKQSDRKIIDLLLTPLLDQLSISRGMGGADGTVNYVISRIVRTLYPAKSYYVLNRGMGILESAKLEYYRRVVAPYENEKMEENGDI